MRSTLADSALTRYAGRFVWLELDFDKPVNQATLRHYAVRYTPTLLVLDPTNETALVSNAGGLSLTALEGFLDAGESRFRGRSSGADSLLAGASVHHARHETAEAADEASRAIAAGGREWPNRPRAYHVLTWALANGMQGRACAETAAVVAPGLPSGEEFGAVVLVGLMCTASNDTAWSRRMRATLVPLAEQAVQMPGVIRDHRFQLYQQLMATARSEGDTATERRWGHRWLDDIEAIHPKDDDERSALDIARVDAAGGIDEPERVLPALIASERAMPSNYNASLRLAEMLEGAKRYDEALAACDRGLAHATGPTGKSWLLTTRANVLDDRGDHDGARASLAAALEVAKGIGEPQIRDRNVSHITRALEAYDKRPH